VKAAYVQYTYDSSNTLITSEAYDSVACSNVIDLNRVEPSLVEYLQSTNCPDKDQFKNTFKLQGVQGTPDEEYKKFSMVVGSCSTISILLG
jgi:hypothetical protein